MLAWNESWNRAFETGDRTLAANVLPAILDSINSPTDPSGKASGFLAVVTCYAILGNQREVRHYLDQAERIAPTDDAGLRMHIQFGEAMWLRDESRLDECLTVLNRMLATLPELKSDPQFRYLYEKAQYARGAVLAQVEKLAEALPILEEARFFNLTEGDKAILYFHLGACYLFLKEDYKSALELFLNANKIGLGPNWQAAWHYYSGRAYYRLKDYTSAKREFLKTEEYIKSGLPGPESSDLYKLLAYSCKGLRQTAEAEMYSRLSRPA